ncbi:hypothetical protein EDB89DRAFT_1933811 [Lactarius sanguifluus]|nr:hypothetical protein EDB89DRAFT_1933811 [Lactarius sanguifluus]
MAIIAEKGVALVTGASQGIGRAIALRLASDGFDVALNDIPACEAMLATAAEEVAARGCRAHCILADVSSEQQVETMVLDVVRALGGLDVMVANAGISMMKSVLDTTVEDFDRILSVNLRGTFLCRGGRILGRLKHIPNARHLFSAYSASKFGIRALTQCAALEFGKYGITVNAYAPGPVKTPMWDDLEVLEDQVQFFLSLRSVSDSGISAALENRRSGYISIDGGRHFD